MKAVIIGAGPAGLAAAACLKAKGIAPVILDRAETLASSWHAHYDSSGKITLIDGEKAATLINTAGVDTRPAMRNKKA